MSIIIRDLDQTRIHYQAAITRVGQGVADKAFTRALNREGAKMTTQIKRSLRKQTGAKLADVSRALKIERASYRNLRYAIIAKGSPMTLSHFAPKQFAYGVRARPWGRSQRFAHAFILHKFSGNVFVRESKSRYPIRVLFGPSIPKEMVQGATMQAFERYQPKILHEATRQIDLLLASSK